jgi:hypothetical protein
MMDAAPSGAEGLFVTQSGIWKHINGSPISVLKLSGMER